MDLLEINDRPGEYPNSWYDATANRLAPYPALKGDERADVCVVGGGFTGLSTALHLAEQGFDVVLLEAQRVGWGASGRNGGQIGSGQHKDQDDLETLMGAGSARTLWDISQTAKQTIRDLVSRHDINCDLRPGVAHVEWHAKHVTAAHDYGHHLQDHYDYDQIELLDRNNCAELIGSDVYQGGTLDWGAAHVHPLNLALGIAQAVTKAGVRIYERSKVLSITKGDPVKVATEQGGVTAGFLVLGCNGYLGKLNGAVAAKVMPINNFIVATEPLGLQGAEALISKDVAIADSKFVVNYFRRSADHRMLFGGGETYGWKFPRDIRAVVTKPMLEVYPQLKDVKLDYAWGGTLAITMNRMPNFERLSGNVFSASGYSGHGVAMAIMAGRIVAGAIDGQAKHFDVMSKVPTYRFPGGTLLRWPGLVMAMTWYALRDRLGF